jgi:lipoprotein-anchoring transpeptidase ErfK/SrfK
MEIAAQYGDATSCRRAFLPGKTQSAFMSRFASHPDPLGTVSSSPPRCRALALPGVLAAAMAIVVPAAASAQAIPLPAGAPTGPVQPAGAAQSAYGGGFFEYLLSGGNATSPRRGSVGILPAYAQIAPDADARRAAADPRYDRQIVAYNGVEKPGTVIINTPERLLYLVEPGSRALRYGIGVGRPGFTWAGVKTVSMKREWPDWRPPEDMLKRRPDLPHYMVGGPENPLGARALYLGSSLYRIHGSNEPWTIGTQVSSGCIRMRNEDVIDLYDRVPVGAKVVVI